jgi:hypothetical protein
MSKTPPEHDNDLEEDYDFSGGVRGKYAERYAKGTNVVLLEPDLAGEFPDIGGGIGLPHLTAWLAPHPELRI